MSATTYPGAPNFAPLPNRVRLENEFLALIDQRKRMDVRIDELTLLLDPLRAPRPDGLPRSGLRLVGKRPGLALYKGGRAHG